VTAERALGAGERQMEVRLATGNHAIDIQDLYRFFHGDELVFRFLGNRFHAMKRALLQ